MSLTVQVEIKDKARMGAIAGKMRDAIQGAAVKRVMGRVIASVIKANFVELANDSLHHRSAQALGAAPTGFYERAAKGVQQPDIQNDGLSVSINAVGIARRLFGGTFGPVNAKFLALPARTESYGKRPREFDNLRAIIFPGGKFGVLVERTATVLRGGKRGARRVAGSLAGKSKGDEIGGGVFFWLVKQVTQAADPTVIPTEEHMIDPALENARSYLERLWEREAA
jgi:hypothetical protein